MQVGGCTLTNGLNFTKSNFASPFGFFHLAFGILLFDCLNDFDVRRVDFRRLVYFRAFLGIFILYPLTAEKTITYEHSESLIYLSSDNSLFRLDRHQGRKWWVDRVDNCPSRFWQNRRRRQAAATRRILLAHPDLDSQLRPWTLSKLLTKYASKGLNRLPLLRSSPQRKSKKYISSKF